MTEHPRDLQERRASPLQGMYRVEDPNDERGLGEAGQSTDERLLLQYEGRIYIRPVGRGVVLEDDATRMQLEDLPDGHYRAQVRVWREA